VKLQNISKPVRSHENLNKMQRFCCREEAGRKLAERLAGFTDSRDAIVLAMPNGGVPVAAEVARLLKVPFDILLVAKITADGCRDAELGTITGGGVRMLDCALIDRLHLSDSEINSAILKKSLELAKREKRYRGNQQSLEVADHAVILVDDGSTPCATIRNAIRLLRRQHAERIVVALPAACHHAACDLRMEADEVVTLAEPQTLIRPGKWFKRFPRTTVSEVRRLLSGGAANIGTNN
jgi:predicted phosphoribosyltransferase